MPSLLIKLQAFEKGGNLMFLLTSFAESIFDAIFLNEQLNFSEAYLVWKIFMSPNMSSEPKSDDIIFWHVRVWAADRQIQRQERFSDCWRCQDWKICSQTQLFPIPTIAAMENEFRITSWIKLKNIHNHYRGFYETNHPRKIVSEKRGRVDKIKPQFDYRVFSL